MTFPSDPDLIAHVLGHLDPPTRERVERALANPNPEHPDLADRHARIAAHLRSYDAIEAPPPPAFASLAHDLAPRSRSVVRNRLPAAPRRAASALGAAAILAIVGLALLLPTGTDTNDVPVGRAGDGIHVAGGGHASELRAGNVLEAEEPAELWLGERVHIVLDAGAEIELLEKTVVRLRGGRAFFDVQPGPFTVRTGLGDVRVVGTTFEVALTSEGLDVRVASGRVEAAGQTIEEGMTLDASGIRPLDTRVGAWFGRPVLRLAVAEDAARTGETALRFTFENPGHVPIEVAGPEGVTAALWLEVEDPASVVHDVAVVSAGSGVGPLPAGQPLRLGPKASTSFTLRFGRPFDTEGAYRCRAMYRPDGDSPLLSELLLVEVR